MSEHIPQSESNWDRYTGSVSGEERQRLIDRAKRRAVMRQGNPQEAFRH